MRSKASPVPPAMSGWTKPEPRWTARPDGTRVRLYRCRLCRDLGIVSLPPYQPGETGADLVDRCRVLVKAYAYPCPGCRGTELGLSGLPLDERNKQRLAAWAQSAAQRESGTREAAVTRRAESGRECEPWASDD